MKPLLSVIVPCFNEAEVLWETHGRLSDELSRRCIRLRIDSRIDMPWLRGGFKHPLRSVEFRGS